MVYMKVLSGARFYVSADFKDTTNNNQGTLFTEGNYSNLKNKGTNDKFSSVKIAPGCRVQMFKHANFQSGWVVTQPENSVSVDEIQLNLRELYMNNEISSLRVKCDASEYCTQNPSLDEIDCTEHCPPGTGCNIKIAEYCSKNLYNIKCKEFCMDPYNNCNDVQVEKYCNHRKEGLNGVIPQECKCILGSPNNDLERLIDTYSGGVYDNRTQRKKGNYACWSPNCRDGTAPKLGQLHLSRWWNHIDKCKPITICNTELLDNKLSLYDNSTFIIQNNCNAAGNDDTAAAFEKLVSSGIENGPGIENDPEGNTDGGDESSTLDRNNKLLLVVLFLLVFVLLITRGKTKVKKPLKKSGI